VLILDDLLWVLTDDQLKAALHFVDSISGQMSALLPLHRYNMSEALLAYPIVINFTLTQSSGFGPGLDPHYAVSEVSKFRSGFDIRRLEAYP
jgi:hypothetical protein